MGFGDIRSAVARDVVWCCRGLYAGPNGVRVAKRRITGLAAPHREVAQELGEDAAGARDHVLPAQEGPLLLHHDLIRAEAPLRGPAVGRGTGAILEAGVRPA